MTTKTFTVEQTPHPFDICENCNETRRDHGDHEKCLFGASIFTQKYTRTEYFEGATLVIKKTVMRRLEDRSIGH